MRTTYQYSLNTAYFFSKWDSWGASFATAIDATSGKLIVYRLLEAGIMLFAELIQVVLAP